jgi:hypothetical protein
MITMELEFVKSTKTMHRYEEKRKEDAEGNNITIYLRKSDLGEEAPQTLVARVMTVEEDQEWFTGEPENETE